MIHAGDTYEAMRLDALCHSLRRAQEAIGGQNRKEAIWRLKDARAEIAISLEILEAQPQ